VTQKIRYARPGDRLSARYINRIVDGANLALEVLNPPRSTRLPASSSLNPELDADGNGTLDGQTTTVYTEQSRVTSLVNVGGVAISRIDTVTLRAESDEITLVFNNT
jgi:hypothetical protein